MSKSRYKKGRFKSKYLNRYRIQDEEAPSLDGTLSVVDLLHYNLDTGHISVHPVIKTSYQQYGFGFRKKEKREQEDTIWRKK